MDRTVDQRSRDGPAVGGTAQSVEHTTDEPVSDANRQRTIEAANETRRAYVAKLAERHQERLVAAKTDDFREERRGAGLRPDLAELANPRFRERRTHDEADGAANPSI